MKNKIISWLLWLVIWGIIVVWYSYINEWNWDKITQEKPEMNDEQISIIAEKSWISEDEIKSRLEAGETMREITGWMWNREQQ